jgi:hypothetical protein
MYSITYFIQNLSPVESCGRTSAEPVRICSLTTQFYSLGTPVTGQDNLSNTNWLLVGAIGFETSTV